MQQTSNKYALICSLVPSSYSSDVQYDTTREPQKAAISLNIYLNSFKNATILHKKSKNAGQNVVCLKYII